MRTVCNKMEEFMKMKGNILKIENPILMFSSILSNTSESQVIN
jgi:hypothetical protein